MSVLINIWQKSDGRISVMVKDYRSPKVIGALEYLKPITERQVKCSKIQAYVTRVIFLCKSERIVVTVCTLCMHDVGVIPLKFVKEFDHIDAFL